MYQADGTHVRFRRRVRGILYRRDLFYKLGHTSNSRQEVEAINVKVDSDKVKDILAQKGYYPAFHMNKKCWVSIILDDTLSDTEIQNLIDDSYASV